MPSPEDVILKPPQTPEDQARLILIARHAKGAAVHLTALAKLLEEWLQKP
jgi:hypothetical protein